jgi:uncharacterized protein YbgA (DUF1722 family)/uncharacterized protein YbbK (DUF523 family)
MTEKIKIGISSCLLGERVRYDGGHKIDHYLVNTFGQYVEWISVCPEVEYGLPVPREPMYLIGDPKAPRLVTRKTGIDHTDGMLQWTQRKLKELEKEELCGFIFKSKSPSSGMKGVEIFTKSGTLSQSGTGIFARAFMEHFPLIPVEDEYRLHNLNLRENFIERVFVFQRWRNFLKNKRKILDLINFHTEHELLLMAHSPKHYTTLNRFIADINQQKKGGNIFQEYIEILMEGLRLLATVKKNTRVLLYITRYLNKHLISRERQDLLDVINYYQAGLVPLIVPITLLKYYIHKFDDPYLKKQHYLNPHPVELMLRNHA